MDKRHLPRAARAALLPTRPLVVEGAICWKLCGFSGAVGIAVTPNWKQCQTSLGFWDSYRDSYIHLDGFIHRLGTGAAFLCDLMHIVAIASPGSSGRRRPCSAQPSAGAGGRIHGHLRRCRGTNHGASAHQRHRHGMAVFRMK